MFTSRWPTKRILCIFIYSTKCGRNLKTMTAQNTKKSLIHENADSNITCEFGDGDINRSRSRLGEGRGRGRGRRRGEGREGGREGGEGEEGGGGREMTMNLLCH